MKLNELSATAETVLGSGIGFVVKSLAHPDRKYRVCYKMAGSGKFAITRLDTGEDFLVTGDADRYDFVVPVARVRTLKADKDSLLVDLATINGRIAEIDNAINGLTGGGVG